MKQRGFSLVEVLTVMAIIALLAALSYPAMVEAKNQAKITHCVSNLRQFGVAINLYRVEYDGADSGTPWEMGLPESPWTMMSSPLRCTSGVHRGYGREYPEFGNDGGVKQWLKDVNTYGDAIILILDVGHQQKVKPSFSWDKWLGLGLRLDGGTMKRRNYGYPRGQSWWHEN